jgi:hypothetical protein
MFNIFLSVLQMLFVLMVTFWGARILAMPLTVLFRPLGGIATLILWPVVIILYIIS